MQLMNKLSVLSHSGTVIQANTSLCVVLAYQRIISQAIRANNWKGGPTVKEFCNAVNNTGGLMGRNKGIQNAWLLDEVIPRFGAGF